MKRKRGSGLELIYKFDHEEWMKADLVESVAGLLKALLKRDPGEVSDNGASILILTYLICQQAGIGFQDLINRATWKVGNSLADMQGEEEAELKELLRYLEQLER